MATKRRKTGTRARRASGAARSRPQGRVEAARIASRTLRGNPLGDPSEREVHVYLPPGYDEDLRRRYPVVLLLTGFTGLGASPFQRQAFQESLDQRLDRLLAAGEIPPMIVASPDCFTSLGGSQYVDSAAVGRYETFVVREVVPFLDRTYRTKAEARHRGVCGKSSGGYGAMMLGMRHPEVFGALASHSGDAYFDYCYGYDFVKCWNGVRNAGGVEEWLEAFRRKRKPGHDDVLVLNILCMAACYSPSRRSPWGFDLPFDLETGIVEPKVMARWRERDPSVACIAYARNLRRLRGVFLDCGLRDEFAIHPGTRLVAKRMKALGAKVVHEEFDDGHMGISYRYDRSFPWLGKWLA